MMRSRIKWLLAITALSGVIAGLVILYLYAAALALSALAPLVSIGPLLALIGLGILLSVVGLHLTRGLESRRWRWLGRLGNGCALAIHAAVVIGFVSLLIVSTKERFIIPHGYTGDVYVIFGIGDGVPEERSFSTVTYRIPPDGFLRTQGPIMDGLTRTEYVFQLPDGSLSRITNLWASTIHPTPENLANDRDVGVYSENSGTFTNSARCKVTFFSFYVGTKAHLLSAYHKADVGQYLDAQPAGCGGHAN